MNRSIEKVGAHRRVHTQGNIEAFVAKRLSDIFVRATTKGFVEDDKLDVRNVGEKLCFCLADDPGNCCLRPKVLNSPNHSQSMASVADRREANDTN